MEHPITLRRVWAKLRQLDTFRRGDIMNRLSIVKGLTSRPPDANVVASAIVWGGHANHDGVDPV